MEKLKPSEEEIIKLGKKIVEELKLEANFDTLARWMSHYLAELIVELEICENEAEKAVKQKQCCEIILKLWQNKRDIPHIAKPLDNLKPFLELLQGLKKDEYIFSLYGENTNIADASVWKSFVDILKENSNKVFLLCIYAVLNTEMLEKEGMWAKEFPNLLSKEEEQVLETIEMIEQLALGSTSLLGNEASPKKRYEIIFDKIEDEIAQMSSNLKELKNSLLCDKKEL